jgi:8-oxo-dGTP pyrophosphatase MutT (NUDIX family)
MRRWRTALDYAAVWTLRLIPVPAVVKEWLVWLASPKVLPVALALIPDAQGNYLLLHSRYSGEWLLPGGIVRRGEAPRAGIRRECREELGQEVQRLTLIGWAPGGWPGHLTFVYTCAPLAAPPRLGPEHDRYRYCGWQAMPRRLRYAIGGARETATAEGIATAPPSEDR